MSESGKRMGVRWSEDRRRMRTRRKPSARWDGGGQSYGMRERVVAKTIVMVVE
mgnify:CR=1 FL=1